MSKSFLKLVDYAIVPAIAIILGKIVGIAIVSAALGIPVSLREYSESILNAAPYVPLQDLSVVASFSDLIMFAFSAGVFSFSIFQAVYLHDSHIKPTLAVRLINKGLWRLIQNSYEIYHSSFVGLIFLWLATIAIIINAAIGLTYVWVVVIAVVISSLLSLILLQDVYREVENLRKSPGQYSWE